MCFLPVGNSPEARWERRWVFITVDGFESAFSFSDKSGAMFVVFFETVSHVSLFIGTFAYCVANTLCFFSKGGGMNCLFICLLLLLK